ncbi:MAG: sensor histidine kinase, partial [Polaromonas sp.]
VIGSLLDISEHKQAEEALRQSHDDLRHLSAHQERIKEEERKRIAREVHDELGGVLTGIKAFLTVSMERAVKASMPLDKLLLDASNLTDVAIDSVRRIITDLRPSVLDQLGVWAALEWHAEQIAERTNLTCTCMISRTAAATELDAERSIMLFRIVQEALTNVVRHAQASAVRIEVALEEGCIMVKIKDDGKGIDTERLLDRESWGISGMYERVRYFGGELKISGLPGQGTTVLLRLPLETAHAD